jgi:N-methylhydantoinase A
VGPRSAGADPGPACYGKGGDEPTVTDAQVALGRLDADKMLGGDLPIDPDLASRAIEQKVGRKLGLSVKDAALGIIRVINSNMALAIRSNSVARGVDPREFSLVPFGGAGPLHGVALAEAVSARDVLVPVAPGITAAMGLLETDMQYEHVRSFIASLTHIDAAAVDRLNALVEELVGHCRRDLENDGVPPARQSFQRVAECRYHGQGFELRAEIPEGRLGIGDIGRILESFDAQHRLDYGYAFDDAEVELITVRVIGTDRIEPLRLRPLERANGASYDAALLYSRQTTFDDGTTADTPRYDRGQLRAGHRVAGPAVLIQHNSTVLVPPAYTAEVSEYGSLHVRRT